MNKEKIKIGILGCGRVCEHYIQKIFISERVGTLYQVIACCDVDKKKSTYVGNIFSCRSYNNIEKFVQHKEYGSSCYTYQKWPTLRTFKNMHVKWFKCNSRKTIGLRIEHARI